VSRFTTWLGGEGFPAWLAGGRGLQMAHLLHRERFGGGAGVSGGGADGASGVATGAKLVGFGPKPAAFGPELAAVGPSGDAAGPGLGVAGPGGGAVGPGLDAAGPGGGAAGLVFESAGGAGAAGGAVFHLLPRCPLKIANWDSGVRWDDPNFYWGDPSYILEPGDPGYVPPVSTIAAGEGRQEEPWSVVSAP
jgi:hypothetical protein